MSESAGDVSVLWDCLFGSCQPVRGWRVPFCFATDQAPYLGEVGREAGAPAKPRWRRHTPALAPVAIHSPGEARSRSVAAHDIRRRQVQERQRRGKKHLRPAPVCLTPLTTLWLTFKNHSWDVRAPPALAACGWRTSCGERSKRFLANASENMGKQSW